MQQSIATSAQYLIVLSQLVASCLSQYYGGAGISTFDASESGIPSWSNSLPWSEQYGLVPGVRRENCDIRYGSGSHCGHLYDQSQSYASGYGLTPDFLGGYGSCSGHVNGYGMGPNYIGGYDSQPAYGIGYGQGINYVGGYDQVRGYGSTVGVPIVSPVGLAGGSSGTLVGTGPTYNGGSGIINEPSFGGYGGGVPVYPHTNLAQNSMIAGPEIVPTQQQATLTTNDNTNTNVNINNNLGKPRRNSLARAILGIPQ